MTSFVHTPAGSGEVIQIGGFGTIYKVRSESTGGGVAVVEHTLEPGLLGAPMHRHANEEETSYVLEGELGIRIGDEVTTVAAGGVVVKPRDVFHTFWNPGGTTLRFLEIITPGGFERYFTELAVLIPRDGPPDPSALGALAARYGMELDFASLPALTQEHGVRLG